MNEIAAILLAAGRSRRMGAFKPLLPFGDKTVIEYCLAQLTGADLDRIIVVTGHRSDEVRHHLKNFPVEFVLNPNPESEMSASIACGVSHLSHDIKATLIALVDQPAVSAEIVLTLIAEWRRNRSGLVQPEHNGRGGHPILIDLAYRAELLNLDPQRGLRALFEAHLNDVWRVAVDSPFVARDMDTWEDYLRLHEDVFGTAPREGN